MLQERLLQGLRRQGLPVGQHLRDRRLDLRHRQVEGRRHRRVQLGEIRGQVVQHDAARRRRQLVHVVGQEGVELTASRLQVRVLEGRRAVDGAGADLGALRDRLAGGLDTLEAQGAAGRLVALLALAGQEADEHPVVGDLPLAQFGHAQPVAAALKGDAAAGAEALGAIVVVEDLFVLAVLQAAQHPHLEIHVVVLGAARENSVFPGSAFGP